MACTWTVYENHLLILSEDESFYHPTAHDIYSLINGKPEELPSDFPADCPNPKLFFQDIRFSKIGASFKCQVFYDQTSNHLLLKMFAERKGITYPVSYINGKIIDHCITSNEWFYISGDIEATTSLLLKADISSAGSLSMQQYLRLIQLERTLSRSVIIDEVKNSIQNKPIDNMQAMPSGLNANLYPYQKTGFLWMDYMTRENCGCILGDEMGLGKTLQIITLITSHKNRGSSPSLIIAPVSLLENWRREFAKFSPAVDVYVHHGSRRTGFYKELAKHDVVVISYNTAISDLSMLHMISWNIVALDEAQNIKNPSAERTKSVKMIGRRTGIAITGTPFENHVSDIWSLVDFIAPGFLGTLSEFNNSITDNVEGAEVIEPILSPLMIRRRVSDVAQDLPDKVDIPQAIQMSDAESLKYEEERQKIINSMPGKNVALTMLQKLRMFCTHPFLLRDNWHSDPRKESTKYDRLCEILEEIISVNEKVILFTSYNEMFNILSKDISYRFNIPVYAINGSTPVTDRQQIVDIFSKYENSALLVLNPRAAGTGLNITAANHVIHYNLEWNPAVEDQASARAYRRGQSNTVFVYRFYYVDTVEQVVNERIERKRSISEAAVVGSDGEIENRNDILSALKLSPVGGNIDGFTT